MRTLITVATTIAVVAFAVGMALMVTTLVGLVPMSFMMPGAWLTIGGLIALVALSVLDTWRDPND